MVVAVSCCTRPPTSSAPWSGASTTREHRHAPRKPSDRIAIIAIDDQSIANIGRWPWPRDVHAELIDKLAAAKAKTIVHTVFFFEPQTDRGLVYVRKIKDALGQPRGNAGVAGRRAR